MARTAKDVRETSATLAVPAAVLPSIGTPPAADANGHKALSSCERDVLLAQFSGPVFDPTLVADSVLHEIFEARAEQCPQRVALWCNGQTMTYAALDRAANQLARHLRARGLGPGRLAAILLPRSMDVSVACWAC